MTSIVIGKDRINLVESERYVAGTAAVYVMKVSFSEDWAGLEKHLIFRTDEFDMAVDILRQAEQFPIPSQVLAQPTTKLQIGAYGSNCGEKVLNTRWLSLGRVVKGTLDTGCCCNPTPSLPTPDTYKNLKAEIDRKADRLTLENDQIMLWAGSDLLSSIDAPTGGIDEAELEAKVEAAIGEVIDTKVDQKIDESLGTSLDEKLDPIVSGKVDSKIESAKDEIEKDLESKTTKIVEEKLKTEVEAAKVEIESGIESTVKSEVNSAIQDGLDEKIDSVVGEKIKSEVGSEVSSALDSQLEEKVGPIVDQKVGSALDSQLEEKVGPIVDQKVGTALDSQLEEKVGPIVDQKVKDAIGEDLDETIGGIVEEKINEAFGDQLDGKVESIVESKVGDIIDSKVADKADKSYVDDELAKKADKSELEQKADQSELESLTSQLENKVDKEPGKGLSEKDFTTALEEKLNGLENYTLPVASTTQLGGVKMEADKGVKINGEGVMDVDWSKIPTDDTLSAESGTLKVEKVDWSQIEDKPDLVTKQDMVVVYKYKGSVNTYGELPEGLTSSAEDRGSVYNVIDSGLNYAWLGIGEPGADDKGWDSFGGSFKIETITNEEIDQLFEELGMA